MLLTRLSSSAASIADEDRASPAAVAAKNESEGDDEDCDLEKDVGLDDVELVGAKRRQRDF